MALIESTAGEGNKQGAIKKDLNELENIIL